MLEIRDVTKIYRSKTGLEVKALDRVSVSFPETGMVFILGKSGSGKSTLLNVIGGLDSYDGGEFIIKGKSSRDFVGSDFDAYRNTFIGFIFQEYNILDDFSVGANIALALELQGKKATSEQIGGILSEVDLLDFAKRKPNELSGGQKQRVAIARALVKDPQIIMADEPTGALDSNTGKQIFDTLKKLSEKKLVIVVSHDRDFAERYGDRIIEMKDGRIDSDVTKHAEATTVLSGGVHKLTDGILKIEAGYELTAEDLARINEYLRAQGGDVFVSGDRRVNDTVRSAAGISAEGKTASFAETKASDIPKKEYKKEDSKFIRSTLPMKNAVKIGSNSLGHKPFRLILTIFLSLIAFALFGFADTMGSYNKYVAATESIIDSNIKNASVTLRLKETHMKGDEETGHYYGSTNLNEDDLALLEEKTGINFIPVYRHGGIYDSGFSLSAMMENHTGIGSGSVYTGELSGLAAPTAAEIAALGYEITGAMPTKEGEIAISKLTYETFNHTGFVNDLESESVEQGKLTLDDGANGILGKHLTILGRSFVITAVIDTQFDYQRYAAYIPAETGNMSEDEAGILDMFLIEEMNNAISYGFHGIGYVSEETISTLEINSGYSIGFSFGVDMNEIRFVFKTNRAQSSSGSMGGIYYPIGGSDSGMQAEFYRVAGSDALASHIKVEYLNGRTTNTLSEKEFLLPLEFKSQIMNVGDADYTDIIFDAIEAVFGVHRDDLNGGYYSPTDTLVRAKLTQYVNDNFAALKAEHLAYNPDSDISHNEDNFKACLVDDLLGYSYNNILSYNALETHKALATDGIFRGFFEALSGETFSENIPESFFSDRLWTILNRYNSDTGELVLAFYEIADLLAAFEAADAIFGGKIDYKSDTFIDHVYSLLYGVMTEEEREAWRENGSIHNAYESYYSYIRQERNYNSILQMEVTENIFGGSLYRDIESKALSLHMKVANITFDDLLNRATVSAKSWKDGNETETTLSGYTLAGFYSAGEKGYGQNAIISDGLYKYFMGYAKENELYYNVPTPHLPGKYAFAIAPMPTDKSAIETLVALSYDEDVAYRFEMQNPVMDTLYSFNDFIETGAVIFMWIGVGFAVFSALMLMNFISVSISYKKREIGILRAVGAKSSDVYKIFFSESAIIALINYVLALVVTVAGTVIVNFVARNEGLNVTLLSFGIRQVILMLLISLFVAAIASFLPVYSIAKKKPVDAIKDK